jgi:D-alanyl-lipoteichoic acid acyltransferase DltB (MBOAT superfamily)
MNFAEIRFWQILFGGFCIIFLLRLAFSLCRPAWLQTYDQIALLLLGWVLLLAVSWITCLIFLLVAVGSYVGLRWLLHVEGIARARYLFLLIPLQLAPLFYYKYADFVTNGVFQLKISSLHNLIIPVGISFYTFQKVAFVIDTLAFKNPLPGFLDYMNFAGFFPQIVAGPIERRRDLLPQMQQFRFAWRREDLDDGARWIVLGLFFKCCLADSLANYFNGSSTTNAYLIWMANLFFGLRIYYDFAGYSLIAVGLARWLGIRLTLNFTSPYCSTSIGEFWRRWHITLSQWFRDYLYIPLGGGRVTWWVFNVLTVFVISGVWHGAGWNFVLWGALHGIFLILNRMLAPILKVPGPLAWLLTMIASFVAWLCFYETRIGKLLAKLESLLTPSAYGSMAFREALTPWVTPTGFVMMCFLLMTALTLLAEWQSITRANEPYYYLRKPVVTAVLVTFIVLLAAGRNNAFIYFAF